MLNPKRIKNTCEYFIIRKPTKQLDIVIEKNMYKDINDIKLKNKKKKYRRKK